MLKRKLTYVICFSILCYLFCQSCQSDSILPSPSDENQNKTVFNFDSLNVEQLNQLIQGNWEWYYSRIFQRGLHPPNNIITPLTSGYTIQYNFEPNNKASYLKNNQFVQSYSYEIKRFKILPDDEGYETTITMNNVGGAELYFSHPDTMMIGTGAKDGINAYFYRKK